MDARGLYHCRVCGQPKRGHICTGVAEVLSSSTRRQTSSVLSVPQSSALSSLPEPETERIWSIPPVQDPVAEAALFNGRVMTERRNRTPFYWDHLTGSLQCLPRLLLSDASAQPALSKPLRAEHLQYHADRQEQQLFLRYVHSVFPDPRGLLQSLSPDAQLPVVSMEDFEIREPKLPNSAFSLYAAATFDAARAALLAQQGPQGASQEAVSFEIARRWGALGPKQRGVYQKKAGKQRERWREELRRYAQRSADRVMRLHPDWGLKFGRFVPQFTSPYDRDHSESQPGVLQSKKEQRKFDPALTCHACSRSTKLENQLLTCECCQRHYHTGCLQLSKTTSARIVKEGVWRCADCKVCECCREPSFEFFLLYCDSCDKGFHTFCLDPPLSQVPEGIWVCAQCQALASAKGAGDAARSLARSPAESDQEEEEEEEEEDNRDDDDDDDDVDDSDDDDDESSNSITKSVQQQEEVDDDDDDDDDDVDGEDDEEDDEEDSSEANESFDEEQNEVDEEEENAVEDDQSSSFSAKRSSSSSSNRQTSLKRHHR